ncbi:TlpA family protein disulfide reductase [bacterium]|nr:TlpA family protein disulfide reductase [bacterium]
MEQIEKFYANQREALDRLEPDPHLWEEIESGLKKKTGKKRFLGFWLSIAAALLFFAATVFSVSSNQKKSLRDGVDIDHISPEVVLSSVSGESIALSSLEGKVVLVEFWASWCNVCRDKNCEELLPLYDQYKDEGFEIYAISVDENEHQWKAGIASHQLPWIHVSDLQGFSSPVSQQFGVTQTPSTFLLDQDHRVIGKNLTRQELEEKLSTCYGGCDK